MFYRLNGLSNTVHNSFFAGGTVGFKNDAVEAEQRRASPRIGVGAALDGTKGAFDKEGAEHAFGIKRNFVFEPGGQALGKAFEGFQDNIADEPVADNDINAIIKKIVSFDVANKIQINHFE